ncbi:serine/threonine-protein kinase [Serinicoccus sp. LYQ131]|uniref:serine/threonine-protein kinase n=1 Tax=Serinicoccus sp. LYQ131 TaxID=3378797 RepID=UPI003851FAE8
MTSEMPRSPRSATADTRPVPAAPPRRLGPYTLHERVGEGGMGVVWRASDDTGREVAIKVLRAHIAHDDQARERLRREVRTLARVDHPRVAAVIDADVDGPSPYVVTEYVPGTPLDQVIEGRGALGREALLRLARGLAEALQAIHARGIVHRDLKPGNVLMVGMDPVVIDFGIAQVADDVRLTSTGLVMGTPGYLSPELVDGGEVTEATDWWGWAACLSFAASGQPPFGRGPMTVILDRVARGRLQLDGVDPELAPLLATALSPRPSWRPSAQEVLEAVELYARGEDVTGALPRASAASASPDGYGYGASATRATPQVSATRAAPVREPGHTRWNTAPREQMPAPQREPEQWPGADGPPAGGSPFVPQPEQQQDPRIGRSARSGVLAALLMGFVGVAAAAPVLAWGLYALWGVMTRTVDRSLTGLVLRRHEAGRRRSDVPMAVMASPWHLLSGALGTVLALLLPLAVAVIVAVVFAGLVTSTELMAGVGPGHPLSMGLGALVGGWLGWWGPGSTSLRRGSRTVVRGSVPTGVPGVVVGLVVLLGGVAAALWSLQGGDLVSWWPLPAGTTPLGLLPFDLG